MSAAAMLARGRRFGVDIAPIIFSSFASVRSLSSGLQCNAHVLRESTKPRSPTLHGRVSDTVLHALSASHASRNHDAHRPTHRWAIMGETARCSDVLLGVSDLVWPA